MHFPYVLWEPNHFALYKTKKKEAAIEKQENPNYKVPKFLNTYCESMCSSVAYGKSITSLNFKTKTW